MRCGAAGADWGVNMLPWLDSLLPQLPHYGYALVFIVVLLNNLGLPLPGETILLGAGFVLGRHDVLLGTPLLAAMLAGMLASFLGGCCAFGVGRRVDRDRLSRLRWLHLTPRRIDWAERLFRLHGARTVFVGRFVVVFPPVLVNLIAGMTRMPWRDFLLFNLAGSAAFSCFYLLLGELIGNRWPLLHTWLGRMAS